MRMIIAGAGVGALAVMVACNEILGSVVMASFHSGIEKIIIRGYTMFDNSNRARWKYADFLLPGEVNCSLA